MRIVLRNKGRGRKDAVYVLDAGSFSDPHGGRVYWLNASWGKWEKFSPDDVSGLQSQAKYRGSKVNLQVKVQKLVAEKMGKGYRVQEECSQLPEWPILPFGQDWREGL